MTAGRTLIRSLAAMLLVLAPATLAAQADAPDMAAAVGAATEMRIHDGRFRVTAEWRTNAGLSGPGYAVQLANSFGYFYFFNADNAELFVKIIDACALNERHWMFAAGLTNVEVVLTVRDLAAGVEKVYDNPVNQDFAPILDTDAFDTCDVPDALPYCFDSNDVVPGTLLGSPVGQLPGELVVDQDGIKMTLEPFIFQNGSSFFGQIEFQSLLGSPSDIAPYFSNLAVEFDFTGLPYLPRRVTFDYRDDGGYENLSINRLPSPPYVGELSAAPCSLQCNFAAAAAPLGHRASFIGEVSYLRFGGQELAVDNVCAYPQ